MSAYTLYDKNTGEILQTGVTGGDPSLLLSRPEYALLMGEQLDGNEIKLDVKQKKPKKLTKAEKEKRAKGQRI